MPFAISGARRRWGLFLWLPLCAALIPLVSAVRGQETPAREEPGDTPACRQGREGPDEAVIEQLVAAVQEELGDDFAVEVVEEWFVVASDAAGSSYRRARGTVRHTYRAMYVEYFEVRPDEPIVVYLFKGEDSYEAYCEKSYGRKPSTPFGFYRDSERKMVMNIATGTGTLAHELVHPLLAHDFPEVPSWFNEGFASLFEQSRYTEEGTMRGMVNWRLPGLQGALEEGRDVSLKRLMSTTTGEFYGPGSGLNYAIARYLCLYLQEQGLLQRYYHAFRDGHEEGPTGIRFLEEVLDEELKGIEKSWKAWVGRLRYE